MQPNHRYKYALSENGKSIFIHDITPENKKESYVCAGCGKRLFPVLGDKREHHFRHEKNCDCSDYNRYLHEYGKAVLKRRFEEGESFFVKYHPYQKCKSYNECKVREEHHWDKCSFQGLYSIDLKKFYDTCTCEKGFYDNLPDGTKRYIADIILTNSKKDIPPTILEVWVDHECTEDKKRSNNRIIEIKINAENDAEREIIETGEDSDLPIRFYGFKDSVTIDPQYKFKHLKIMNGIYHPVIVTDESPCIEGVVFDNKSLFEVVVSSCDLAPNDLEKIMAAKLEENPSLNLKLHIRDWCQHFTVRNNRILCQGAQKYRNCPCPAFAVNKDKMMLWLENLKKNDIEIWTSNQNAEQSL